MSWLAFCCPFVAMGQILTRLRFSWIGTPGSVDIATQTFRKLIIFTVCLLLLSVLVDNMYMGEITTSNGYILYTNKLVRSVIDIISGIFLVWLIAIARLAIRKKSDIPATACGCECGVIEDVCCAIWCQPCTICQMASHTADYKTYPSVCCTRNGLPENSPILIDGFPYEVSTPMSGMSETVPAVV